MSDQDFVHMSIETKLLYLNSTLETLNLRVRRLEDLNREDSQEMVKKPKDQEVYVIQSVRRKTKGCDSVFFGEKELMQGWVSNPYSAYPFLNSEEAEVEVDRLVAPNKNYKRPRVVKFSDVC